MQFLKKAKNFTGASTKYIIAHYSQLLGFSYIFGKLLNLVKITFLWPAVIVMIVGIFLKFKGFVEIEPLRGILEGDLIFEKESIIINNKSYSLNEINTIKISNDDYRGKLIHFTQGNVGPALSNGTNNSIILF